LFRKDWTSLFKSAIPFSLWLVSFGVNYLLFTQRHAGSEWLVHWFAERNSFVALPPTSAKDLKMFMVLILDMFHYSLGLSWIDSDLGYQLHNLTRAALKMPFLPVLAVCLALVYTYRHSRHIFLVLIFPFLLVFLASGLRIYPLLERMTLFLAPLLIILAANGCEVLMRFFRTTRWKYIFPALLLIGALGNSLVALANPIQFAPSDKRPTEREALFYINDRFQPGDAVYVYWNFGQFYRFYKEAYPLKYEAVLGRDVRKQANGPAEYSRMLAPDVVSLSGKRRVWLVYRKRHKQAIGDNPWEAAWYKDSKFLPGSTVYSLLAENGKEIDSYETSDVKASLFDLSIR
jgi:hypothetical protein